MSKEEDFIKIKEAAKYTGFTVGTLYVYVFKRKIPFHKLPSGGIRFSKFELKNWMRNERL